MIKNFGLADTATFGNITCGMIAIFLSMHYCRHHSSVFIFWAVAFILFGLVFDMIDGPIARMRNTASPFGRELDSFADAVSFGIAPAVIAYALGFNTGLDSAALIFFIGCCLSRLARFNVMSETLASDGSKVTLVVGLPIAYSLLPVGVLTLVLWSENLARLLAFANLTLGTWTLHTPVLFYPLVGLLMTSERIRFYWPPKQRI